MTAMPTQSDASILIAARAKRMGDLLTAVAFSTRMAREIQRETEGKDSGLTLPIRIAVESLEKAHQSVLCCQLQLRNEAVFAQAADAAIDQTAGVAEVYDQT